jgi:UDP-N-acetylglucosamine acyltransferase
MIHATAIIEDGAQIGDNVTIGPYATIGGHVKLGDNCIVESHAFITGRTTCGKDNHFYPFVSIGAAGQDKKYNGEDTETIIGNGNTFREYCSLHRGTVQDKGVTQIGNNGLFMAYSHIGHDVVIRDNVILSNNATLAGHVFIDDHAIVSGLSAILQRCRIGKHAFIKGMSGVAKDVPPFVSAFGNLAKPVGVNVEGMKRCGFTKEEITATLRAYKTIYRNNLLLKEALEILESDSSKTSQEMVSFIRESSRGIVR